MSWVCEMPGRYNNSIQTTAATIASATIDQKIRNNPQFEWTWTGPLGPHAESWFRLRRILDNR
jgi:hypothetical protein